MHEVSSCLTDIFNQTGGIDNENLNFLHCMMNMLNFISNKTKRYVVYRLVSNFRKKEKLSQNKKKSKFINSNHSNVPMTIFLTLLKLWLVKLLCT